MKPRSQIAILLLWVALAFPCPADEIVTVLQILDGDTCQLDDDRRVRYLGIDAPEKGEPGADEASQANNALIGGQKIRIETGKPERDASGRLLAYVFVGKTLVNEELLRQGHAYMRRPVLAKYKEALSKAQDEARKAGRGIWAKAADRHIAITLVHAKPESGGSNNLKDEYVVLENHGDRAVNLTGWTLSDEGHHRYLFPRFTFPAGAKVTLRTGLGKNTAVELFWGSRISIWNDNGDTIFLRDAGGRLVLTHVY